jgi:hypothetical protein
VLALELLIEGKKTASNEQVAPSNEQVAVLKASKAYRQSATNPITGIMS